MAKRKPKPATAGEKIEMKRCGLTLDELRSCGNSIDAANVDRAIARAVKRERLRCQVIVCVHRNDWIKAEKEIRDGVKP